MTQTPRHYGFAQVPRDITRGEHKKLTLVEKGLYTCLKDICGDDGECFYTFRNLASEINTSISTLSRYIPKLASYGIITAEKKPGNKNGHEIYHITITDIWLKNDDKYRPQEIVSDRNKVTVSVSDRNNKPNIVSDRNRVVSDRNNKNGHQAQDCFNLNDRVREEEEPEEEENSPPPQPDTKNNPKGIILTENEQSIFNWYCQLWFIGNPPRLTADRKQHCAVLARRVKSQEDMDALEKVARSDLKQKGIRAKVIELGNLVNSLNNWLASQGPKEPISIQQPPCSQSNWREKAKRFAPENYEENAQKVGA